EARTEIGAKLALADPEGLTAIDRPVRVAVEPVVRVVVAVGRIVEARIKRVAGVMRVGGVVADVAVGVADVAVGIRLQLLAHLSSLRGGRAGTPAVNAGRQGRSRVWASRTPTTSIRATILIFATVTFEPPFA